MSHVRRWGRMLGLGAAAVVIVLLAATLALSAHGRYRLGDLSAAFAARVGSLDPASYNLAPVPVDDNAAVWLKSGADGLVFRDADKELLGRVGRGVRAADWDGGDRDALGDLLARNRAALDELHRAAALGRSNYGVDYGAGRHLTKDELWNLMLAARLLKAEGRLGLLDGDGDRFGRSARALARVAVSLQREPTLTALLIGVTSELALLDLLNEGVASGGVAAEAARPHLSAIGAVDLEAQLATTLAAETAIRVAALEDGAPGVTGYLFGPSCAAYLVELSLFLIENQDRPFARLERDAPEPGALLAELAPLRRNSVHAVARVRGTLSLRRLAEAALAARAWRARTGAWPSSPELLIDAPEGEPFWHQELVVEPLASGGARFTLDGAAPLWATVTTNTEGEIPFSWTLRSPDGGDRVGLPVR